MNKINDSLEIKKHQRGHDSSQPRDPKLKTEEISLRRSKIGS
jgi:hypothetical protein